MFHRHKWEKIKETYAPPFEYGSRGLSRELAEKLAFGVTTVLWECSACHKLRKEEMLGKSK